MKPISDFHRQVRPLVRGCPTPVIDEAIRHSAIEFCDYTHTWRIELPAVRIIDGKTDYVVDTPKCGRLSHVLYVSHNGTRVLPTTERQADDTVDGWRTSEADVASYYYLPDRKTIRLLLTPTTTDAKALKVVATFKPTVDATELDDDLYHDHLEALSHGALMRLFGMDGQAWANPAGEQKRMFMFKQAKDLEKSLRLNDYTRQSTLTIRPVNYYG